MTAELQSSKIRRVITQYDSYQSILKSVLTARTSRNPSYSLRAFARGLGIHHTMLVQVFQRKKRLSSERAEVIVKELGLNKKEAEYFCLLVQIDNAKHPEVKMNLLQKLQHFFPKSGVRDLSVEHFQIISEWYHVPILQMVGLKDFTFEPKNIAKRLDISTIEAELALERLEKLELIEKNEAGVYRKTEANLLFKSIAPAEAIRKYHHQMLLKGIESITTQTAKEKWIGSETFAIDSTLLPEADQIIEQFLERMVQLSYKSEKRDHIYHLNTCFFKLTQTKEEKKK